MRFAAGIRPEGRAFTPSPNSLKVISYNILAPKYASYNSYCPPQFLAWEYRRAGLLRELDHLSPDLLGLQECDMEFFNQELQGWMSRRGMRGLFLERPVGPVTGQPEGIALIWREEVLEAVASRQHLYSEMDPGVAGLPPGLAGTRPWSKLRELGEGVLMALLRHKPSGRLLVAAVTHLFWNPAFPDVKALQAALLCGSLSSFVQKTSSSSSSSLSAAATAAASGAASSSSSSSSSRGGGVSGEVTHGSAPGLVLFGDFNSLARKWLPDKFDSQVPPGGLASGVYTLLSHGSLPAEHPDHPTTRVWEDEAPAPPGSQGFPAVPLTGAQLQLASLNAEAFGREPPLTTRTAAWAGCIDFVWLSRGDFAVVSALAMPYSDDGLPPLGPDAGGGGGGGDGGSREPTWRDPLADIAFTAIPDEFFPSDHLAVGGEVMVLQPALPPPPQPPQ